jgi:hypothetical protein
MTVRTGAVRSPLAAFGAILVRGVMSPAAGQDGGRGCEHGRKFRRIEFHAGLKFRSAPHAFIRSQS